MEISPEIRALIEAEEECLRGIIEELHNQRGSGSRRFAREARRAQDLTAQIVTAKRDTDKQMLASDEAVAHGLTKLKKEELDSIDKLLERPYFARLVLLEDEDGKERRIEFRLGQASNIECRIIDWRRAPLAKLFYEYREGDSYFEEIQGRERSGKVLLRHKVGIEKGELRSLSCALGDFEKTENGWVARTASKRSGDADSYGQLPGVLSLITPEQFQTITEESDRAVLIRGVAGSGKTTVAIHRLAYLLAEENSDLKPDDAAVVVLSPGLAQYIRRSLSGLGVTVPVMSYSEWIAPTAASVLGLSSTDELATKRTMLQPPPGAARVLRSLALLRALEAAHEKHGADAPEREFIWRVLGRPHEVLDFDETKLLDRDVVTLARKHLEAVTAAGEVDSLEEPLLVRLYQLRNKTMRRKDGRNARYRHLMVDEVQDFYPAELASVIGGVEEMHQLTLVGDTSQASRDQSAFPVWDKLRKFWSLGESLSRFVNLAVSHRSTAAIVRLAQHIQGVQPPVEGRPGKPPLWYHCETEDQGVEETLGWLTRVTEKYPTAVTAVICRSAEAARWAHGLLEPTFGPTVTLAENGRFDFQEGIVVTPVDFVKGLEFPHVLIWNASAESYPAKDQARSLLYIAVTRAEDHLCLVTWGRPSPLLPQPESNLVRGIRRTRAEDAAAEAEENDYGDR